MMSRTQQRSLHLATASCLLLGLGAWLHSLTLPARPNNFLDGCRHVYLDMGTHQGVQIRKLFEPDLFPGAPVLKVFEKFFGNLSDRAPGSVCAVGWEPNVEKEQELAELEEAYRACGWRVKIFARSGVGARETTEQYATVTHWWQYLGFRLPGETEATEYEVPEKYGRAGRLVSGPAEAALLEAGSLTTVSVVRIAAFINTLVATRRIPPASGSISWSLPPSVVMKLDIEGREAEVVADLVMSGALGHLDNIHVDWPTRDSFITDEKRTTMKNLETAMTLLTTISYPMNLSHVTEVVSIDDEEYYNYKGHLPKCHQ